jgi:hypothetical protein
MKGGGRGMMRFNSVDGWTDILICGKLILEQLIIPLLLFPFLSSIVLQYTHFFYLSHHGIGILVERYRTISCGLASDSQVTDYLKARYMYAIYEYCKWHDSNNVDTSANREPSGKVKLDEIVSSLGIHISGISARISFTMFTSPGGLHKEVFAEQ